MDIPNLEQKELFAWLKENKQLLITEKKSSTKHSDGLSVHLKEDIADKANKPINANKNEIKVRVVINTTNIMDSHNDVHLKGIWNKSLKENKNIFHLQEHEMKFDKIIADSDDLEAYTKFYKWSELGFDYEGRTQALVFDSVVKAERNPFMFQQYAAGRVKNHSVGMQYVKIDLAINSKEYPDEKAIWDKYVDEIVNQDAAKAKGYFFAVQEAKIIEGSAVPVGSNRATPTLDNNLKEPSYDTPNEPWKTLKANDLINNYKKFRNGN